MLSGRNTKLRSLPQKSLDSVGRLTKRVVNNFTSAGDSLQRKKEDQIYLRSGGQERLQEESNTRGEPWNANRCKWKASPEVGWELQVDEWSWDIAYSDRIMKSSAAAVGTGQIPKSCRYPTKECVLHSIRIIVYVGCYWKESSVERLFLAVCVME